MTIDIKRKLSCIFFTIFWIALMASPSHAQLCAPFPTNQSLPITVGPLTLTAVGGSNSTNATGGIPLNPDIGISYASNAPHTQFIFSTSNIGHQVEISVFKQGTLLHRRPYPLNLPLNVINVQTNGGDSVVIHAAPPTLDVILLFACPSN